MVLSAPLLDSSATQDRSYDRQEIGNSVDNCTMEMIDLHAHCVPPEYREYCLQNDFAGKGHPDGMPAIPPWDTEAHLALMKERNIKRSILSISSPGTHLTPGNDAEARKLTRHVNEDIAAVCAEHPEQFGWFASLPLPDVEGSLIEIDHAFDAGAIGVQILTNSHGVYPGDERFIPVFDKLDERKAIVFFHPTTSCVDSVPSTPQPTLPRPLLEFMFDSTRAIVSLLLSTTLQRCPNLTVLACHCAGTLPPLFGRVTEFASPLLGVKMTDEEARELLRTRFYFDLAGVPFPDQVHGLLRLVDKSRLVYGSDFPYTPPHLVKAFMERIEAGNAEIGADLTQNAKRLLREES